MPYSWFNVTNTFGNAAGLSYVWTDEVTYHVPFVPGNYSVERITGFLQEKMKSNGHYLLDPDGDPVFYLHLNVNNIYYAVTVTSTPIPATLPISWKNPAAVVLNGKAPQLIIHPAPNTFGALIGYRPGTYPAMQGTTATAFNSQDAPVISPVTVVNVTCNWTYESRFNSHPSLLASFTPMTEFGTTLSYEPSVIVTLPVTQYQWSEIELGFFDQDFRPLALNDLQQIQISLILEHYD